MHRDVTHPMSSSPRKRELYGKSPRTGEALAVQYEAGIQAVDDLVNPPVLEDFVAPGFIFPTVITGPEERIVGCVRNLARAKQELAQNGSPEAYALEAFHIEGPYISPEDGPRGAHPLEHIRPPDLD